MKRFSHARRSGASGGFTLTEATFSLGLLSVGFIAMAPLFAVNLAGSRQARDTRMEGEIAQAFAEQAQQGQLPAGTGTSYFDSDGQPCAVAAARYQAVVTLAPATSGPAGGSLELQRMTLQLVPVGDPVAARTYVRVLPLAP